MIKLPPLPYDYNALEPALSAHQVKTHYDKHTRKYYDTLNDLIKGTIYEDVETLEELLTKKTLASMDSILFNNAAQAWNHTFLWNSLTPNAETQSTNKELADQIKTDFGSLAAMKKLFIEKATQHFGSGWCWIVLKNGKLIVKTSPNATTPLVTAGEHPLAAIDLWEHAYLYDPQYEADRTAYVNSMWTLLNWNFIYDNFTAAK